MRSLASRGPKSHFALAMSQRRAAFSGNTSLIATFSSLFFLCALSANCYCEYCTKLIQTVTSSELSNVFFVVMSMQPTIYRSSYQRFAPYQQSFYSGDDVAHTCRSSTIPGCRLRGQCATRVARVNICAINSALIYYQTHVCGFGYTFGFVCPCVRLYVCVCLQVRVLTFESLNLETSFLVRIGTSSEYLGHFRVSRSSCQGQGHRNKNVIYERN